MINKRIFLIPLAVVFFFGFWGLRWGLPSQERAALFLTADQHTPEFYAKIERVRLDWYEKIGQNPIAHLSRAALANSPDQYPKNILLSYSSFLIRTHNADEQATLVMLSHLNPLKGRWYPYNFQYGGAYIYPLAVFMGIGKILGLVSLVPNTAYYYANPNKIADVFFFARIWSLIGLALTVVALFKFTEYHWDARTAMWAALFYALCPAVFGLSKIVKPHIWSPLWTLLGMHFALEHKKNTSTKSAALSAVFFGVAIGTTISQVLYSPFLGWCLLQKNRSRVVRNGLIVGTTMLAVFIALNPTLPFHFDDFKYEQLSTNAHLVFAWHALSYFFFDVIANAAGRVFAALAYVGTLYFCFKGNETVEKPLAWFVLITSLLIAFQIEGTQHDPQAIRAYMAHLVLLSLFVSLLTFKIPFGAVLRFLLFIGSFIYGTVYCRHFASDWSPNDNASQASMWIQKNLPKGTNIGLPVTIPLVDLFPPLPFEDYAFTDVPFGKFTNQKPPFFILNGNNVQLKELVNAQGYKLIQRFATSPLQRLGFQDRLSNANFPVEIYERTEPNK